MHAHITLKFSGDGETRLFYMALIAHLVWLYFYPTLKCWSFYTSVRTIQTTPAKIPNNSCLTSVGGTNVNPILAYKSDCIIQFLNLWTFTITYAIYFETWKNRCNNDFLVWYHLSIILFTYVNLSLIYWSG